MKKIFGLLFILSLLWFQSISASAAEKRFGLVMLSAEGLPDPLKGIPERLHEGRFKEVSEILKANNGLLEQSTVNAGLWNMLSGWYFLEAGDWRFAQSYLLRSMKAWEQNAGGDKNAEWKECTQFLLAQSFIEEGLNDLAERVLLKDLQYVIDLYGKSSAQYGRTLGRIAYLYYLKDELALSEQFFKQAEEAHNSQPTVGLEGLYSILTYRALLYSHTGQFTASEALLRKQKSLMVMIAPSWTSRNDWRMVFSELYRALHNYGKSFAFLEETKKAYNAVGFMSHQRVLVCEMEISRLFMLAEKPSQAYQRVVRLETLPVWQNDRHPLFYDFKRLQAQSYSEAGKLKEADSLYSLFADSAEVRYGALSLKTATLYSERGEHLYRMATYDEAFTALKHSVDIQKEKLEPGNPEYLRNLSTMALVNWARGKDKKALAAFRKCAQLTDAVSTAQFAFLSEKEKELFYHSTRKFYEHFNEFVLYRYKKGDVKVLPDLYGNQYASKGVLFRSDHDVKMQILDSKDSVVIEKYNEWIRHKEILVKLYKIDVADLEQQHISLDSLEEALNDIEKELNLRTAASGGALTAAESPDRLRKTFYDELDLIKEGDALIEMIRIPDFRPDSGGVYGTAVSYAALIMRKGQRHPSLVVLENGAALERKRLRYQLNMVQFKLRDTISYEAFIGPILNHPDVKGTTRLFISPDGAYNQININTLFNHKSNQYVLQSHDVHLLAHTREYKATQAKADPLEKIVALGYPEYFPKHDSTFKSEIHLHTRNGMDELVGKRKIVKLPGTLREVEMIQKVGQKNGIEVEIFTGTEAIEDIIKEVKTADVLHIATHGFFIADEEVKDVNASLGDSATIDDFEVTSPLLRSGLLLVDAGNAYTEETMVREIEALRTGEPYNDGILLAYEALNLDLRNTQLVVLSACETGMGEIRAGEGVYGLQRSFRAAGADHLVMSLWKVDDEATMVLMNSFYTNWFLTKDMWGSFRKAQLEVLEKYKYPVYWGAFVMVGM
jgi:CHAT domain-containing protein